MTGPFPFDVIVVKVMSIDDAMSLEMPSSDVGWEGFRGDGGWSETYIIATNEHHNTQSCSICFKLSMFFIYFYCLIHIFILAI